MQNEHLPIKTRWVVIPRGDVELHRPGLHISMTKKGEIILGRRTHERLGAPEAYVVKLDPIGDVLALEPATFETKNAYPARVKGDHGGKILRVYRLVTEYGIRPPDTIQFMKTKIDLDGTLLLSLKDIRISPKAHSQCRGKRKSGATQGSLM